MKILYSIGQLYKFGGVERVISTKINAFAQRNHEIVLVTSQQHGNNMRYALDKRVRHIDLKIDYVEGKSFFSFHNLFKTLIHLFKMFFLLRKEKPDIVICVGQEPDYIFLPFLCRKTPKVREFHSSRCNELCLSSFKFSLSALYKIFIEYIESLYAANVVLNIKEKDFFKNKKNVFVIPNPIEIKCLPSIEQFKKKKSVVALGRVAKVKGYDLLLKSWALVFHKHPDWTLEIYGDGDKALLQNYQNEIEKNGLSGSVYFNNPVTDVFTVLLYASIFVLSSREESFGMVILEAQMCGLPVVAFNCPTGPASIIHSGVDGILVEPFDTVAFAEAVCRLIENNEYREKLVRNALNNVYRFDIRNIIIEWESLFGKLVSNT